MIDEGIHVTNFYRTLHDEIIIRFETQCSKLDKTMEEI